MACVQLRCVVMAWYRVLRQAADEVEQRLSPPFWADSGNKNSVRTLLTEVFLETP